MSAAALRPAQAKAPAAAAPVPVVAQALESLQQDSGPVSSLSRIPISAPPAPPPPPSVSRASGEAVQRKCETCDAEEKEASTKVRTRLEVGAADDPFEHEADAIAHSVMAIPEGDLIGSARDATGAAPSIQRACAACSATRDEHLSARRIEEEDLAAEIVRRRTDGQIADADESEAPRMRGEAESDGPPGLAATSGELTTGGSPLSASARQFFEPRMGRDLSHVRVHSGHASSGFSQSISARAFTYRNHIWLGRSERHEISFTMAHELAHVLQQTAPGPVGPGAGAASTAQIDTRPAIRREVLDEKEPFFFPRSAMDARALHTQKHNEAQDALRGVKANKGMLTEVPMPGADRSSIDIGEKYGFADLYFAGTKSSPADRKPAIIGVQAVKGGGASPNALANFTNTLEPDTVAGPSGPITVTKGPRISFAGIGGVTSLESARAPKIDWAGGKLDDTADMPTNIKLGEIKPAHSISYRQSGVKQLKNYVEGIDAAAEATNRLFPGTGWVPFTKRMMGSELDLPKDWDPSKTHTTWPEKDIELRWSQTIKFDDSSTKRVPGTAGPSKSVPKPAKPDTIDGRWMIARGSRRKDGGDGVFVYYLHPKPADLRKALKNGNVSKHFERRLADVHHIPAKLRTPPKKASSSPAKPKPRLLNARPAMPLLRRKAMEDDFSAAKWEAFRRGNRSLPEESRNNVLDQLHEIAPQDILALVNRNAGLAKWAKDNPDNASMPSDITSEASGSKALIDFKFLQKAAFWTGDSARLIGLLRDKFGTIVVKGINKFEEFKQKVSDKIEARKKKALERDKKKRGGIMLKAAKGVMAALLPLLVMPIVRQTYALIMSCVESGFKAKFETLLPEEGPVADLQQMATDIQARIETMATEIEATIDAAVTSIVGEYEGKVEKLVEDSQNVLAVIGMIKDIANGLRIGACLISLATAPETLGLGAVVGCGLAVADWILGQLGISPIDYVIAKTIETCPNKNAIGKIMAGFAILQEMPAELAKLSVGEIKKALRAFVPGEMLGKPLGDHAAELLCDESKIAAKPEPFTPIDCGSAGGDSGGVPDLPQDLVDKTFKDGDPITDGERVHMEGREQQVPPRAASAVTGDPASEGGEQSDASGTATRVVTRNDGVQVGEGTPKEFHGFFVHGIESGFPSEYDSKKNGGKCFPKKVKFSIHDSHGFHSIDRVYDVEICKIYRPDSPAYPKTPVRVAVRFSINEAFTIVDAATGARKVSYAVRAGDQYGAWMAERKPEDK
ncbi:eCIS core domain-containing protein [Parerythrobacter lacustris]|uniref:DUF4157 domain-containing protein n=1 Tax=Parerythrobacter lacustris TaxID=2969984 RepID=A0ABT1XWD6_9SPHN|nr:DUF4157 domain-containing protein [Parerythrobacter lacustris]MCR2835276.1 DUF4157 domain-containing protein [Parerythrobacter lacustris]